MHESVHTYVTSLSYPCCNLPSAPSLSLPPTAYITLKKCVWGVGRVRHGKISKVAKHARKRNVFPCKCGFWGLCVLCLVCFFLINVMKPTTFPSISRKMWTLLLCYEEEQWRQSSSDLSKIAKGIWLRARTSSVFSNSCLRGNISSLCLALPSFLKFLTNWNGY